MTYTREQVLAMTAEELRLAILKAQGWTYQQDAPEGHSCLEFGNNQGWWLPPDGTGYDWLCAKCQFDDDHVPNPTRDIGAAWGLRNEMAEHGIINVSNGDGDSEDVDWFGTEWGSPPSVHTTEATTPLAISRAWLLWREGQG